MLAQPVLAVLLAGPALATQAVFTTVPAGPLDSSGLRVSVLNGVSADGSVAVGAISDPVHGRVAIRWTPAGGTTVLPSPGSGPTPSFATGISDDLSTVVGARGVGGSLALVRPVRWDAGAAPIDLTTLPIAEHTKPAYVSPEGRFVLGLDERIFAPTYARQGLLWDETGALVTAFPSNLYFMSAAYDGSFFIARGSAGSVRVALDGTIRPLSFPLPAMYGSATAVYSDRTATVFGGIANVPGVRDDVFLYDESAQTMEFAPGLPGNGRTPHRMQLLAPDLGVAVVTYSAPGQRPGIWIPSLGTAELVSYADELGANFGPLANGLIAATAISDDGTRIVGSAFTSGVQEGWMLTFPEDWWRTVGTTFCNPATPNSTGHPSRTMAFGSDEITAGALRLETHGLPPNVFGIFAVAPTTGGVTPPGSAGPLCLGGAIGRFDRGGQLLMASPRGRVRFDVDLGQLPGPNGPRSAAAGETWHFQFWHRDVAGSTSTNFSNAVTVIAR